MLSTHRAFPTIPATDLNRAKAWYRDKLGLTPAMDDAMGLFYDLAGGTGFLIYPTMAAGQAPNTLMAFESTAIKADVAALKARGVVFEEYDMPGLKTEDSLPQMGDLLGGWFKDSEGNIIGLSETPKR